MANFMSVAYVHNISLCLYVFLHYSEKWMLKDLKFKIENPFDHSGPSRRRVFDSHDGIQCFSKTSWHSVLICTGI